MGGLRAVAPVVPVGAHALVHPGQSELLVAAPGGEDRLVQVVVKHGDEPVVGELAETEIRGMIEGGIDFGDGPVQLINPGLKVRVLEQTIAVAGAVVFGASADAEPRPQADLVADQAAVDLRPIVGGVIHIRIVADAEEVNAGAVQVEEADLEQAPGQEQVRLLEVRHQLFVGGVGEGIVEVKVTGLLAEEVVEVIADPAAAAFRPEYDRNAEVAFPGRPFLFRGCRTR